MRLRTARLKTKQPLSEELVKEVLASLPAGAMGFGHEHWPVIEVVYLSDYEV